MECNEVWLQWVVELQSIAQEGLFYGKDLLDELQPFADRKSTRLNSSHI